MTTSAEIRFELRLDYFPNEDALREACQIIYRSQDKTLLASLSSTPYIVGRSFSREEQIDLAEALRGIGVAFLFKSKPPFQEEIAFDPRKPVVEENTSPSFKFPFKPLLIGGGLLGVLVLTSIFAPKALDFSFSTSDPRERVPATKKESLKTQNPSSQKYDASLDVLQPKVEFREASELFWKNASSGLKLEYEDAVRTYSNAGAVLRYRDGSFVRLRENTLLVVGETKESTELGTERSVELKDGSLQARLQASEKKQTLSIETTEGTLEITNQQGAAPSDTQVSTKFSGGRLEVSVREGAAEFRPKEAKQQPIRIQKNQSILKSENTKAEIIELAEEIILVFPAADHKYFLRSTGENKFKFEWEAIGEQIEYQWNLYSDSKALTPLLSQKTQETRIELNYLDPGELYWSVHATHQGVKYESPIRRLYVEKHDN